MPGDFVLLFLAGAMALASVGMVALAGAYRLSPVWQARRRAKQALTRVQQVRSQADRTLSNAQNLLTHQASAYVNGIHEERLRAVPIEDLKRYGTGIRMQPLRDAGIRALADFKNWPTGRLVQLRGIGPESASRITSAVTSLTNYHRGLPIQHPLPGNEHGPERSLLEAIFLHSVTHHWLSPHLPGLNSLLDAYVAIDRSVRTKTGFFSWAFSLGRSPVLDASVEEVGLMEFDLEEHQAGGQILRGVETAIATVAEYWRARPDWKTLQTDIVNRLDVYKQALEATIGPNAAVVSRPTPPPAASRKPAMQPLPKGSSTPVQVSSGSGIHVSFKIPAPGSTEVVTVKSGQRERPDQSSRSFWVPPGNDIVVSGFTIRGGMVYVGRGLRAPFGDDPEPGLVDPGLPVAAQAANCHTRTMGYWPSYSLISAEARASYLQWLATGKEDPAADVGYAFLYLYGLERRILWDAARDEAVKGELNALAEELRRLLGIYGANGSFRGYARSLLDYLAAQQNQEEDLDKLPVPQLVSRYSLDFQHRRAFGLFAKTGRPISADWALSWLLGDPASRFRNAFDRCPQVFRKVFASQFNRKFGQGMPLPLNKTKLKVSHRPANGTYLGHTFTLELDVPDVTVLSSPLKALAELSEITHDRLDGYSRFIGRNPGQENSLDALLLLPPEFWPDELRLPLAKLAEQVIADGAPRLMRMVDLQVLLPEGSSLSRVRYQALARALGSLGVGLEPDARVQGAVPSLEEMVAVFPAQGLDRDPVPSDAFGPASLLIHLAAVVSCADGGWGEEEMQLLLGKVQDGLGLPESERHRLEARLALYKSSPPALTGLKKRIEVLKPTAREAIGDFLVEVVHADGIVDPGEVRSLEKVYKLLDLDQSSVYTKLHIAPDAPRGTLPVAPPIVSGRSMQPVPSPSSGIQIDMARVAALRADSARIGSVLSEIFSEAKPKDDPDPVDATQDLGEPTNTLLGLDPEHHGLLTVLLQRPQWQRDELEELCTDRGLMVDGALERINDAAFERYQQGLIEGLDPLEVNIELIKEEAA